MYLRLPAILSILCILGYPNIEYLCLYVRLPAILSTLSVYVRFERVSLLLYQGILRY